VRLATRPTWLTVLVATVTGYCLGNPETIVGAFREDGLPFLLLGSVVVLAIVTGIRESIAERHAEQRAYAARLEAARRRRSDTILD
jgi:hypothetical protein